MLSRRTRDAKHLDNGDGAFTEVFRATLHYQNDLGAWQDTDHAFRSDRTGGHSVRHND
jgi:hypothetical protein